VEEPEKSKCELYSTPPSTLTKQEKEPEVEDNLGRLSRGNSMRIKTGNSLRAKRRSLVDQNIAGHVAANVSNLPDVRLSEFIMKFENL